MRNLMALVALTLFGCGPTPPNRVQERFEKSAEEQLKLAQSKLVDEESDEQRLYWLGRAAKDSFFIGKTDEARQYADELFSLLPQFTDNSNYGVAVQDANVVRGRIALLEGRTDEAKQCLINSVQCPGPVIMPTFGPNMSLAKDLLESGETDVVLKYFELCRKFWKMENGRLDKWSREVRAGRVPDFGGNLVY